MKRVICLLNLLCIASLGCCSLNRRINIILPGHYFGVDALNESRTCDLIINQISEEEYKRQAAEIKKDKSSPIVMIKATDDANYKNLIDALDEMQICNISKYAIVDLAEADEYLMKNLESAGDYSKKFDVDSKSTTH